MGWKEKLKWKILVILIALLGILIVWCAGKAGEKRGSAGAELLKEYMIRENEWASAERMQKEKKAEEKAPDDSLAEEKTVLQPENQEEAAFASTDDPSIKVLLMTTGYTGYYHEKAVFQFQGEYELRGADNVKLSDGETLELSPDSPEFSGGSVTLVPLSEENRAVLLSVERGQGNPAYKGSMVICRDEQGLRIVNELPLEAYLCAVVPSEMPASYHEEALKAQAVCARTYACVQMQGSKLETLGAQVDDSVSFQVYQNSQEAEASSKAVMDTAGQILLNNGIPITAYYFSTSHGKTSTDEVWQASAPSAYLKSVACRYYAGEPWYQWYVTLSREKLLENARKIFQGVQQVESVEIKEKGEGDAVLYLAVYTDQGEKALHSEYDIRSMMAPAGSSITRQDGSSVKGGALLPSAYFSLEEQKDGNGNLTGYLVRGGGYGHGVGMSQNGARGMAEAGKTYQEILSYFYKDVEIGHIKDVVNSEDS